MNEYEDHFLSEDFQVESSNEFMNGLNSEEEEFLLKRSGLIPCSNCGEWVNKKYAKTGICNLCLKSETHSYIRGNSREASSNCENLTQIVRKLEELRRD